MRRSLLALAAALALGACSGSTDGDDDDDITARDGGTAASDAGTRDAGEVHDGGSLIGPVPSYAQRPGDPAAGYTALVNAGYVGCGIPKAAYDQAFPGAPPNRRLPGRDALNETLPYDFNAFVTTSSVTVVASNCLTCHAAIFDGEIVMGLGDSLRDFTNDPTAAANAAGILVPNEPAQRAEYEKWRTRIVTTAPFIRTQVVGTNPADNLAAILFAHRDPETLAWSDTPLLEEPERIVIPVDVPPWWRMSKKNAMFYHAAGREDHARIMMTASVLCVDTVEEAASIDAYFPDVRAYIASLEAPAYPDPVDSTQASMGEGLFNTYCARCHGTYGANESYPNLVVSLEELGTDPLLAQGAAQGAARFRDWFHDSFYGEISRLDPAPGYIAPPLDGVWLTAPYLHNGSVPDLETLLDSSSRPTYWTRTFRDGDYDMATLGWTWTEVDHGHAGEPVPANRIRIYDTTLPGHSNGGHTFGDVLTAAQRAQVIEYLKTL